MANPTQFTFSIVEATEILIKAQGITEGKWMLVPEFNLTIGAIGQSQDHARPGVMILINNLTLVAAEQQTNPPPNLVVDAALVHTGRRQK